MHSINENSHCSDQSTATLKFQKVQPTAILPPESAKDQGRYETLGQTAATSKYHDERGLFPFCEYYLNRIVSRWTDLSARNLLIKYSTLLLELTFTARDVRRTANVPALGQRQCVTASPGEVLAMQLFRSQEPAASITPHETFHELDWFSACFNCRSTQILLCLSELKAGTATVTTRELTRNSRSVPSLATTSKIMIQYWNEALK